MAFQYKKDDPRGKPRIRYVNGEWQVVNSRYSTNIGLLSLAEKWCQKMNWIPFDRIFK